MSWVFLSPDYVYKLKKPVRYEYLDFSTLEARRHDCEEEVRLNRRLAEDVYLGTVALAYDEQGRMLLGGEGTIVDWLVWMRRLPRERMLDRMIARKKVERGLLTFFVRKMNRFYRQASPAALSVEDYLRRFRLDILANARELSRSEFGLPTGRIAALTETQLTFLQRRSSLLAARVLQGRVVEGHGDLRPEHVCLLPEPRIIDCLEFNRDFRLLDSADELAYLGLECERLGAQWVSREILQQYAREAADPLSPDLLAFYRIFRGCLRAKIAAWHIRDHHRNEHAKWSNRAVQYLNLAAHYARRLNRQ